MTNLDLLDMTIPVEVSARPMRVADQFERTRVSGWGRGDTDWRWRDPDGGVVDGSVADGAGRLSTDGLLTWAESDVVPHVTVEVLLIGRFSSCTDPNQVMGIAIDDRTPLFLRADGQLFSVAFPGRSLRPGRESPMDRLPAGVKEADVQVHAS